MPNRSPLSWSTGILLGALGACSQQRPAPMSAPAARPAESLAPSVELAFLDRSVDPCTDFYAYACGGWLATHPIPDDRAFWGRGSEVGEKNLAKMHALLDRLASEGAGAEETKLGTFWSTCMDETKAEELAPLRARLAEIDRIVDAASLARGLARLHRLDPTIGFEVWAEPDYDDATRQMLHIGQSGLGLPDRDDYFGTGERERELRTAYVAHVASALTLVGSAADKAKADATKIMALETKLADVHATRVDLRDPASRFHRLDRAWLRSHSGGFAWDEWFTAMGLGKVTELDVAQPEFFVRLSDVLRKTPLSDVRTFLRWKLIESAAPSASAALVDEDFHFRQVATGARTLPSRWKRCVRATDIALRDILARRFVDDIIDAEGRKRAKELIGQLQVAMRDELRGAPWLDDATRAAALEKLQRMHTKAGLPDVPRNYGALEITTTSHLENVAHANAFALAHDLERVDGPIDAVDWQTSASTGDCNYRWGANEIIAPGAMLQPPLFGKPMTRAMELGAFGTYLGHEISHGFDDEGRHFDAVGNRRNWWTPAAETAFTSRAACVRNRFEGRSGPTPNGALTLGENLADLGGMKLGWDVLRSMEREAPPAAAYALPEERQFFTAYAQGWCRNIRPKALASMLAVDPHAPPRDRVNGTLADFAPFAEVFSCKPGSPMVHAPRCEVW